MEKFAKMVKRRVKKVMSFALDAALHDELRKYDRHTEFIAAVVAREMGSCPCCGGKWPEKVNETPSAVKQQ
jgi:hypothetical protein